MNWTAVSSHAVRLVGGLAAALAVYAFMRQANFAQFTAPDGEGINSLISLIGSIYAVVFAFVIFVIWGQFTGVEEAALRECSLLNELLRFSQYLNPDVHRAIRRAVSEYVQRVADSEWHSLGERRKDQPTEKSFATLIGTVVRTSPRLCLGSSAPWSSRCYCSSLSIRFIPGSLAPHASVPSPSFFSFHILS